MAIESISGRSRSLGIAAVVLPAWWAPLGMVLSLTGLDEVKAHVGRELGVSERRLVTRERLDAFAHVAGEERPVHLNAEC